MGDSAIQRKATPKNMQTTVRLSSFHMLARSWSKSLKLGFSTTWTKTSRWTSWVQKIQRNRRLNCQHSLDPGESKRIPEKHVLSTSLTAKAFLTVWISTNHGKFLKRWEYQTTVPVSWETCMQVKKQQLEPDMEQMTGSKLGGMTRLYIVTLLI